jgi:hypothetical protein
MNNDALVAALGMDAVAAVHGYRRLVLREAERRGLRLVSEALSEIVRDCAQAHIIDPIDIRLAFQDCPGRPELGGRVLRWGPAHGWSVVRRNGNPPVSHFAGPGAGPVLLVPTAPEVVAWAAGRLTGPATPPAGVELDDDPRAIRRLLGFIGAERAQPMYKAFLPADRPPRPPTRRAG